jgi:outer membrane protein OmpA-like peptidoglycan-associated protein
VNNATSTVNGGPGWFDRTTRERQRHAIHRVGPDMNRKSLVLAASAVALALASPAALSQWHHPHVWVRPYPYFYYPYGPRFYPYPWFYGVPVYRAPLYVVPRPAYVYPYYPVQPAPAPQAYGQHRYGEGTPQSEVSRARIEPPPRVASRIERTVLSARELFDFDKATIRGPVPKLDEIAETMKREPGIERVRITGYTDRIGTKEYNDRLSLRRAQAVKQYLVSKGVAPSRLLAEGKGMSNPVVACNDKNRAELIKCLEPNRRVEVEQIVIERRVPQG